MSDSAGTQALWGYSDALALEELLGVSSGSSGGAAGSMFWKSWGSGVLNTLAGVSLNWTPVP